MPTNSVKSYLVVSQNALSATRTVVQVEALLVRNTTTNVDLMTAVSQVGTVLTQQLSYVHMQEVVQQMFKLVMAVG